MNDNDLWEEHGEWAAKNNAFPEKMGDGPLFEAQHKENVINWLHNEPWYQKIMARNPKYTGKLQKDQFGGT